MICVSIADGSSEAIEKILDSLNENEIAEIRLDQLDLNPRQIESVFSKSDKLIATCRTGKYSDQDRLSQLKTAVAAGAGFIDIEVESEPSYLRELVSFCRDYECKIIVSHHDYNGTPSFEALRAIVEQCFASGADIAKIACMAHSKADSSRILALYEEQRPLVAIAMGIHGKITRVAATLLGAPFTFASLQSGKETAAGQLDRATMQLIMKELIDGI
jgi:3-dehydroquinate dehydratase-1